MSYYALRNNVKTGDVVALDTSDLVIEKLNKGQISKISQMGLPIAPFTKQTAQIGIASNNNRYDIHIYGYNKPIYSGEFPLTNNRGNLFNHDIKLIDIGVFKNTILIVVGCNVWCKYDIEFPMVMVQVISFSFKSCLEKKGHLSNGILAAFTSEPIMLTTGEIVKRQYKQCFGDYPDKCISQDSKISIGNQLILLGVVFTEVPIYEDLCKRLKFFKLPSR